MGFLSSPSPLDCTEFPTPSRKKGSLQPTATNPTSLQRLPRRCRCCSALLGQRDGGGCRLWWCKDLCGLRVCCQVLFPLISQLRRPGRESSHSLAAASPAAQGNYIYHLSVVKLFPLSRAVPFLSFPHTAASSLGKFQPGRLREQRESGFLPERSSKASSIAGES